MNVVLAAHPRPESSDGDALLVGRARQGDHTAFRALYLRHARYIAGVVHRLLGTDAELDDIVQDTFVTAASHLAGLRTPELVRRWLVTIAIRHTHRRLARRRRRALLHWQAVQAGAKRSDPRDRAPADDLYDVLDRIPERVRIPWFLHRIDGERLEDVAEMCGTSLATVKRRIADAQTRIDRRLQR